MNCELYKYIFWPILILISIAKPLSDFIWLKEFKSFDTYFTSLKYLFNKLATKNYCLMIISGIILWFLTIILLNFTLEGLFKLEISFILIFTIVYIIVTIISIKSVLVVGLILVTYGNFLLIHIFYPLTEIKDVSTLNNLLTNMINTFNYSALATTAVGLVWQFGVHHEEDTYATISTMFYSLGFILLNMFISFVYLFLPTINQIKSLSSL